MSYVNAIVSVSIISTIPNLLLYFIPTSYNKKGVINLQHVLLSFASGGLLGDVFIHALPHILLSENESFNTKDSHVRAIIIGSLCLLGFFIFYAIEKIVSALNEETTIHEETDFKSEIRTPKRAPSRGRKGKEKGKDNDKLQEKDRVSEGPFSSSKRISNSTSGNIITSTQSSPKPTKSASTPLKPAAILNLIADVMHNFCDGLAIGATYASGKSLALATTVSIFFHEIPHELGDYSILVESGYTKEQAIRTQMVLSRIPPPFHLSPTNFPFFQCYFRSLQSLQW